MLPRHCNKEEKWRLKVYCLNIPADFQENCKPTRLWTEKRQNVRIFISLLFTQVLAEKRFKHFVFFTRNIFSDAARGQFALIGREKFE